MTPRRKRCAARSAAHGAGNSSRTPRDRTAASCARDHARQAVVAMREWLGQGFWRPGDLAARAAVVKMTPVYVPYWVFDAERTPIGRPTVAACRWGWRGIGIRSRRE